MASLLFACWIAVGLFYMQILQSTLWSFCSVCKCLQATKTGQRHRSYLIYPFILHITVNLYLFFSLSLVSQFICHFTKLQLFFVCYHASTVVVFFFKLSSTSFSSSTYVNSSLMALLRCLPLNQLWSICFLLLNRLASHLLVHVLCLLMFLKMHVHTLLLFSKCPCHLKH